MSTFAAPVTPYQVSSSIEVSNIKLSPDGSRVIYIVQPICKKDKSLMTPSSLWIGETNQPGSERQLTGSVEQAKSPSFHPDGKSIIYLSDRHEPGGSLRIHSLNISGLAKPKLLGKRSWQPEILFSISPNGEHIAFTTADAESDESDDGTPPEGIHVYALEKDEIIFVSPHSGKRHVNGFVWAPNSRELLYYTWPAATPESRESLMPLNENSIGVYICSIKERNSSRCIGHLNQSPGPWQRQSFVWPTSNEVINISKYDPVHRSMDGMAAQYYSVDNFDSPVRVGGEIDTPDSIIDLHFDGMVAILVERDLTTAIEIWKGTDFVKTILVLHNSAISTASASWDIKRLPNGTFKVALIKSSGILRQPEEVWVSSCGSDGEVIFDRPLTMHNKILCDLGIETHLLGWDNKGTRLEGTVTYPPLYKSRSGPLPTILLIHSGPYSRTTPHFKLDKFRLQLFFASHGYLVLSPNYRGSSGRGSAFARVSGSQLVTESWSDCDSMMDHAVSLKTADPTRLALAGHSSGGYLAALGASVTKGKYKACVTWSGPSDLSALTGTSQTPEFQFSMSGLAPWYAEPEDLLRNVGGRMVHPSPVRNLADVETAFLILHGEEDTQVPVSQAMVLWRGLKRLSKFPERHAMRTYRREGHVFAEQGHLEDGLKRMLEHIGKYLA